MPTRTERLLDAQIRHSVGVHRRASSEVVVIERLYRRTEAEIRRVLSDLGQPPTRERWARALVELDAIMRRRYDRMLQQLGDDSVQAGEYEVEYQSRLLRDLAGLDPAEVTPEEIRNAVFLEPIVNIVLHDWTRDLERQQMGRLQRAVDESLRQPDATLGDVFDGVFAAGALVLGLQHLRTWARTVLGGAMAKAREILWGKQPEIQFQQWVGVLDLRITPHLCLPRHGELYDAESLEPVGHDLPWDGGPGRIHHQCRSHAAPILRGDPVPQLLDGDTWLRRLARDDLEVLYGKRRAEIFLAGDLEAEDLVGNDGQLLTIEELRRFDGVVA